MSIQKISEIFEAKSFKEAKMDFKEDYETVIQASELDNTGNKKNTYWIINAWKGGAATVDFAAERANWFEASKPRIKDFAKDSKEQLDAARQQSTEPYDDPKIAMDLYKYTFDQLDVLFDALHTTSKKKRKEMGSSKDPRVEAGSEIMYENNGIAIVKISNYPASIYWSNKYERKKAHPGNWCISSFGTNLDFVEDTNSTFRSYASRGIIYYITNTKAKDKFLQRIALVPKAGNNKSYDAWNADDKTISFLSVVDSIPDKGAKDVLMKILPGLKSIIEAYKEFNTKANIAKIEKETIEVKKNEIYLCKDIHSVIFNMMQIKRELFEKFEDILNSFSGLNITSNKILFKHNETNNFKTFEILVEDKHNFEEKAYTMHYGYGVSVSESLFSTFFEALKNDLKFIEKALKNVKNSTILETFRLYNNLVSGKKSRIKDLSIQSKNEQSELYTITSMDKVIDLLIYEISSEFIDILRLANLTLLDGFNIYMLHYEDKVKYFFLRDNKILVAYKVSGLKPPIQISKKEVFKLFDDKLFIELAKDPQMKGEVKTFQQSTGIDTDEVKKGTEILSGRGNIMMVRVTNEAAFDYWGKHLLTEINKKIDKVYGLLHKKYHMIITKPRDLLILIDKKLNIVFPFRITKNKITMVDIREVSNIMNLVGNERAITFSGIDARGIMKQNTAFKRVVDAMNLPIALAGEVHTRLFYTVGKKKRFLYKLNHSGDFHIANAFVEEIEKIENIKWTLLGNINKISPLAHKLKKL